MRGVVFGVFDGLHKGHTYFLDEAAKECGELFVVVATDTVVENLKNRTPRYNYEERTHAISEFNPNLKIMPSDPTPGTWKILIDLKPDIVLLGYDQLAITKELKKLNIPHKILGAYHPEKYKSSLLP